MTDFEFKDKYSMDDLLHIMDILRSPGGCPWDAEQTHESIKMNFIEETYETVEAIDKDNPDMLCEELGDVLLQVVFHTRLEKEKGVFDFGDVTDGICKKLIIRHPHVFGDVTVNGTGDVLKNWDEIKRQTKNQKTTKEAMEAVPREFPALMRSEKLQSKGFKAGFGEKNVKLSLEKIKKATNVLCENEDVTSEKIGKLLFEICGLSATVKESAEDALTQQTDRYMNSVPDNG